MLCTGSYKKKNGKDVFDPSCSLVRTKSPYLKSLTITPSNDLVTTRTMTARAAPSPRLLQPYSPRRPSPLGLPPMGFPPLAPHMAFLSPPYPATPDRHIQPRGPTETRVPFPPEARRPLAGKTQRPRSQPVLEPLTLNTPHHPPTQPQHTGPTQPGVKQDMTMRVSPPSPTPSETSSLSLYSAESTKNFPIDVVDQKQREEDDRSPSLFCACLSASCYNPRSKIC